MNYQSWKGVEDPKFGYGAMFAGFIDSVPKTVKLQDNASSLVHMGIPQSLGEWFKGQYKSCFTMWESDKLPAAFLRWLPIYEQILVPCEHNLELFSKHHGNVKVVPLGVDNKFWKPTGTPDSKFRFQAGGSLWERKGLDLVVKAFTRLKLPDAELHIKAAPHARDVPNDMPANVYLNRNWMTLEEQRDWFNQGHVFIAASRGEGFGLMPLQAIASGIPTILTATTGQKQFAHLATSTIPTRKVKAQIGGYWDEADIDQLAQAMLDHYQNWDIKKQQALFNAVGTTEFTWSKATKALISAVPSGEILLNPETEKPHILVPIQVKKNMTCDIGKKHYQFLKGETYAVDEGVHQVLFDADVLL